MAFLTTESLKMLQKAVLFITLGGYPECVSEPCPSRGCDELGTRGHWLSLVAVDGMVGASS